MLVIGAAYKAKVLCSGVFVLKRSPQDVLDEDLEGILSIIHEEIDFDGKSVSTSFPGIPTQRAIFRDGLGCTLLAGLSETKVRRQTKDINMNTPMLANRPGDIAGLRDFEEDLPPEVSSRELAEALDRAFLEMDPDNPIRTRAAVVVYDGQIIAEQYAPGTAADYLTFPRKALFDRIGMRNAIIEPDASGTFVGSSIHVRHCTRLGAFRLTLKVFEYLYQSCPER